MMTVEGPSRWQRSKTWRSPSSPQIHQKYIYMWNNSYRTPTECWQKTSDFPKGKKIPTYLSRAKEKRKNRDKRIGMGPAPLGGSWEGGKVSSHQETRQRLGWRRGKLQSHGGECSNKGAEGKAERFLHRGSVMTSTHQPERLVCSPSRAGGCWELRLGLQGSDPKERTGVGCVNTQPEGVQCATANRERVQEKVWNCLRLKRPLFQGVQGEEIQSTMKMSFRDRRKLCLSAQTPETGMTL